MGNKIKDAAPDAWNSEVPTYKVIIVGDNAAACSILNLQYNTEISEHKILVECPSLKRELPQKVELEVWKLSVPEQERYRSLRFYQDADVVIMAVSDTKSADIYEVDQAVKSYSKDSSIKILLGYNRSYEAVEDLANDLGYEECFYHGVGDPSEISKMFKDTGYKLIESWQEREK